MDPKLSQTFKELGDIYGILGIEATDDLKKIEKAYRKMAKKLHPDYNKAADANDQFNRLKKASTILLDSETKKAYDNHLKGIKDTAERYKEMRKERADFATDLIAREKQEAEKREQEKKDLEEHARRKKERLERMNKEREEDEEQKRKEREEEKKRLSKKAAEFTTIQVKWPKDIKISYNQDMLNMMFSRYGEIANVIVLEDKRKAFIEFKFRISAEKAAEENKKNRAENLIKEDLKVKLLHKEDKKVKKDDGKKDMNLTTDNLNRIADVFNSHSDVYRNPYVDEVKRIAERKKLLERIVKTEVLDA